MTDSSAWKDISKMFSFKGLLFFPWLVMTLTMHTWSCLCSALPLLFSMEDFNVFVLTRSWGELMCSHIIHWDEYWSELKMIQQETKKKKNKTKQKKRTQRSFFFQSALLYSNICLDTVVMSNSSENECLRATFASTSALNTYKAILLEGRQSLWLT